jgi:hypothetical protein
LVQGYFVLLSYKNSEKPETISIRTISIRLEDYWKEQQKIISTHIEEIITFLKNKEKEIVNNSNER